ncbi:MAG: acetyl-CoA C-acyltransferase [Deltaproteobacteria bacterium]|nr:acetyl-CoA C-acyltransferase [Deltaproteobacteria bacterium]
MSGDGNPRVAIMGGARTPFVKAGTVFRQHRALDLACHSVDGLLQKQELDPALVDELIYGIVTLDPGLPHMAREVVFSSRLPAEVRAVSVSDNCITGLTAMAMVHDSIRAGRTEVGIAGGVESMSNPALRFGSKASRIFMDANSAKTFGKRLGLFAKLRPKDFLPRAPSVAEPSTGLSMGDHTELMVKEWKIERGPQDELALASHQGAHRATEDGRLPAEIHPLDGLSHDTLIRPTTTLEKLAKLRPVFDRSPTGTLTAGNSSPLTDGAASVLLMSEAKAKQEGRTPLAILKAFEFASIHPDDGLLMGPGLAVPRVLRKAGLTLGDMDLIEMHEAFGGQVLCNLKAWEEGWKEPAIGAVDRDKLNVLGSSLAVGHPFAATGARIATTLANEMKRRGSRYGLISICGAGATAAAMILESYQEA